MVKSVRQPEEQETATGSNRVIPGKQVHLEELQWAKEEAAELLRKTKEVPRVLDSRNILGDAAFNIDDLAIEMQDGMQRFSDLADAEKAPSGLEATPGDRPAMRPPHCRRAPQRPNAGDGEAASGGRLPRAGAAAARLS